MKIIGCPDLHIREKRPENRTDKDYFQAQFEKIEWILKFAASNDAVIFFPGDVFDSPTQSNFVLQKYINLFYAYSQISIGAVAGQHDMRYHSTDPGNTALAVLDAAHVLYSFKGPQCFEDVTVYGCNFGEAIPEITSGGFNILVIHKMIVDDKLWEGQEEFEYAPNILRKNNFDLIISGDNHKAFHVQAGKKFLFNCGSLMRSTTAQLEHIPQIVLFDTDTKGYEIVPIPVKPISEVFDLSKIEEKKEKEAKFEAFVKGLSESKDISLNFQDRLISYVKENEISNDIYNLIMEAANGRNS